MLLSVLIAGLCLLNVPLTSLAAEGAPEGRSQDILKKHDLTVEKEQKTTAEQAPTLSDQKKKTVVSEKKTVVVSTDPQVSKTESMDGMTWLYIGGAVAGVAVLAAALGAGGSTDSDSGSSTAQTTTPVGPNLHGSDWGGTLTITRGTQGVTATVVHNGASVNITTSTNMSYGRNFTGSSTSSGHLRLRDTTTGQTWTTFGGPASSSKISIFDIQRPGGNDYDKLKLLR